MGWVVLVSSKDNITGEDSKDVCDLHTDLSVKRLWCTVSWPVSLTDGVILSSAQRRIRAIHTTLLHIYITPEDTNTKTPAQHTFHPKFLIDFTPKSVFDLLWKSWFRIITIIVTKRIHDNNIFVTFYSTIFIYILFGLFLVNKSNSKYETQK